jgi:hypothetical protein
MDDLANLKTPEQVKKFDMSDVARAAVKPTRICHVIQYQANVNIQ